MDQDSIQCTMQFAKDENGREVLLKDGSFQVMMEWEKPYMEACIEALTPSGHVLEIGFGCGYSAAKIQKYRPKSHTIIEYHPVVAEKARRWAAAHQNVTIVENTWQKALHTLGAFDTIFFDDYPLESPHATQKMESEQREAQGFLAEGQKKMDALLQQIKPLQDIQYPDEALTYFFEHLHEIEFASEQHYLKFFADLKRKGNITESQLNLALKRLQTENIISSAALSVFIKSQEAPVASDPFCMRATGDRLFQFLELCLKNHMNTGCRFSCYLNDPTSKFEDEKFFKNIITNPYLEYTEKTIPIEVPANCRYYQADQALVITITKLE